MSKTVALLCDWLVGENIADTTALPSPPRFTPGCVNELHEWSPVADCLRDSVMAPLFVTIAPIRLPTSFIHRFQKALDIDKTDMTTATTAAMPTTMTRELPRRCGRPAESSKGDGGDLFEVRHYYLPANASTIFSPFWRDHPGTIAADKRHK